MNTTKGEESAGSAGGPRIIVTADRPRTQTIFGADWVPWVLGRNLAIVFLLMGGADLALLWYPPAFGSPEFEFATISRFVDGLPVFMMGLGLLALTGIGGMWRGATWTAFGISVLFAVLLMLLAAIFVTDVPIALRAVQQPMVQVGVRKAIAKALFGLAVYWFFLVYLAVRTFQSLRGSQ